MIKHKLWYLHEVLDKDYDYTISLSDVNGVEYILADSDDVYKKMMYQYANREFLSLFDDETDAKNQFNDMYSLHMRSNRPNYNRIYQALYDYDYNPTENYDRYEESERLTEDEETHSSTGVKSGNETLEHGDTLTRTGSVDELHGETVTRTGNETLEHGDTLTRTGSEELNHGDTLTRTGSETLEHGDTLTRTGSEEITHGETVTKAGEELRDIDKSIDKTGSVKEEYDNIKSATGGTDSTVHNGGKTVENYKSAMNAFDTYTKDTKSVETYSGDGETVTYGKTDTKTGATVTTYDGYGETETVKDDLTYLDVTETHGGTDVTTYNNIKDAHSGTDTTTYNSVKDAHSGTDTTTYNSVKDEHSGTDTTTYNNIKDAHSGTDTTTYNTLKDAHSGTDKTTYNNITDKTDGTDTANGTDTFTSHIHGNIGVTSAMQLITEEIELRKTSLLDMIIKDVIDELTIYC